MISSDNLVELVGRLHIVVVHFPIAFLLLAALIELISFAFRRPAGSPSSRPVVHACVILGALGAVVAAAFGWIDAWYREFHGTLADIIFLHRWGGISVATLAVVALYIGWLSNRRVSTKLFKLYRALVICSGLMVGFVAHYGGLLVHGEDYYKELLSTSKEGGPVKVEFTEDQLKLIPASAQAPVDFVKDIHPILHTYCNRCHGEEQAKGGLRLDSREAALKGGKSGPAMVPGFGAQSLMIQLAAGLDPKRVMPNKGKRLSEGHIAKVRAWIDQGAQWDSKARAPLIQKASYLPRKVDLPSQDGTVKLENPIDRLLAPYFAAHNFDPGPSIDDRTFARRVYLDIVGVVPTYDELQAFLAIKAQNKRERLVDQLLQDRTRYASNWLNFWNDVLRNGYSGPGFLHGGRREITPWLYSALFQNIPYNKFAATLINPISPTMGFVKGILWWKNAETFNPVENPSVQAAQNVAQVFLGINLKCASCHDSFIDEWKLADAYGMANIYAGKQLEMYRCDQATGNIPKAKFLIPELGEIPEGPRGKRQDALASMVTSPDNGRFARTIVNRMWQRFFGFGLIEPLDELDNPSWNQDLLDWLANYTVESGYDLQKLMKLMFISRAYQSPAQPGLERFPEKFEFRGPMVRRMSAEQFVDSVHSMSGTTPKFNNEDSERLVKVALKNFAPDLTTPDFEARLVGDRPLVRYLSTPTGRAEGAVDVTVNVSDARRVWFVVQPAFRVRTDRDKLAEKFSSVARSDAGLASNKPSIPSGTDKALTDVPDTDLAYWGNFGLAVDGKKLSNITALEIIPELSSVSVAPSSAFPVATEIPVGSRTLAQAFGGKPFYVVAINLPPHKKAMLHATYGLQNSDAPKTGRYTFAIMTDLPATSALVDIDPLLKTLGRPDRSHVVTQRLTHATTLQTMDLMNNDAMAGIVTGSASRLLKASTSPESLVRNLFRETLSRDPQPSELKLATALLSNQGTESGSEDLLWSVLMLPEFQFIT